MFTGTAKSGGKTNYGQMMPGSKQTVKKLGLASRKVRQFAQFIDSDSDSYGSQGGLKEKPKPVEKIKKRGGKKRNKNKDDEEDEDMDISEKAQPENKEIKNAKKEYVIKVAKKDDDEKSEESDNGLGKINKDMKNYGSGEEDEDSDETVEVEEKGVVQNDDDLKIEEIDDAASQVTEQTNKISYYNDPAFQAASQNIDRYADIFKKAGSIKTGEREDSPPMIKEYDPNEDNAKIRAARRREELKKREVVQEVDLTQFPEDPRPWKGKQSDFFIIHETRRSGEKVLNNSQKEFLLIYYPDNVVNEVSMMEFLQKQAKAHETREREREEVKQIKQMEMRGNMKKQKKRQRNKDRQVMPEYVQEIKHINQENRYLSQQPYRGGVNFDLLLNETNHTKQAGLRLYNIREQIEKIQTQATSYYDSAQTMQAQHADMASTPGGGYCTHCHHNLYGEAGPTGYASQLMGPTHTEYDTHMLERQKIMQQICEAKKRQARMEAEEARRLRDEARRLADQAQMLDLESQRPLLEAKRLEQEAMLMERQFGRVPQHVGGGASGGASSRIAEKMGFGSSQPPATPIQMDDYDPYVERQRRIIEDRRDVLIAEAQTTQFQIGSLQQNAQRLEQSSMLYRNQSHDIKPLYQELEQNRARIEAARQASLRQQVAAQNAQMYAAKAIKEKEDRAERVALEDAQKDAMKAKTELAKLQAKQAKAELKQTKKTIKEKEAAEIRADRGRGREEAENKNRERETKRDLDGGDAYGEEVQYEWRPKEESKQEQIDSTTKKNKEPDQDDDYYKEAPSEEEESDDYSSEEEPMGLKNNMKTEPPAKVPELKKEKSQPAATLKKQISQPPDSLKKQSSQPAAASSLKKVKEATPKYDQHEHYDQEVDYGEEDPEVTLANQEFLKAKKMFEKAQKAQEDAKKKKEREIQKQKDEILQAQEQANSYFAELKRQKEEEKKSLPKKQIPNNQQSQYETGAEFLYTPFDKHIETMGERSKELNERYSNRYSCQEFLSPILSGRIINEFNPDKGYINFEQHYLEDNFEKGHDEYFKKWKHLFLFEAYSYMMNSRWSKFTGSDIDLRNQLSQQKNEKALCWKGYFVYKQMEGRFCGLKMLKEPMNVMNFNKNKNYSKIYDEPDRQEGAKFELNHCREEDLIVMSKQRINLNGQEDIKMAPGGLNFLRDVLSKQGVTFGFVYRVNTKTNNFVEVLVDPKYTKTFQAANETNSDGAVFTRYCYFFESLLTACREFRALKQIEFTRMCPILCYPSLALEAKDKMLDDYCDAVAKCFESFDDAPDLVPKIYYKDEEQSYHQMNHYLLTNHNKFNKSQAQVLENVIEMPKDEVLLIQGPPGTGKTHTIIGIISMILSTRLNNPKQKIMVCAPSNAAIDQIILRIVEKGLIGLKGLKKLKKKVEVNPKNQQKDKKKKKKDEEDDSSSDEYYDPPDLTQSLVRITSAEYVTETAIKKYTLEQRILKKLCIEKFGDLKKCIKELKEMSNQMDDFDCWEEYQDFPYCNKIKFKNYSKILNAGYLRKVHNWGDVTQSREQQKVTFTQQLRIHEKELNEFKSGQNMEQGNMEWKDAEQAIINESNIICCTLSMAGSSKLYPFVNCFEYLIVDEACQSTEPSTLIPFQHGPKRIILVGDQKQLPATTFSGNSEETGYCRSLFERLLDSGYDKTMLTIQFRMHPKIRAFPSEQFYGGAITDHQSIGMRNAPLTIANLARIFTSRMVFFDIQQSDEILDNKSKCNIEEADFTKLLIDFMARKMSLQGTLKYIAGQIGVISPYKAQVRQLYSKLEQLCSDQSCNIQETIEVNTVDAFQGSEKDIIIFNCVRSNAEEQIQKSLGFLLDERRLNVAITRPKFFLLIVGNAKTLQKSDVWDNMIRYAMNQGRYVEIRNRSEYEFMTDLKKYVLPQLMDY